jgi:formamidopyrimidine-DNA glycosylase
MPELPEVETIRRELVPLLIGRRIERVVVRRSDIVGYPQPAAFARGLRGRTVKALGRRGKYLVIELDRGSDLVVHLRLSGHLEVVSAGVIPKYERVRFDLSGKKSLSFAEPRVLGRVYLVEHGNYPNALAGMQRMGEEPVGPKFSADYLGSALRGRRATVKTLLLDQRVCCGVGNIYSDEALFRARVRPTRPAGRVTKEEVNRLARAFRDVLNDGIKWCGTTMADERYVLPNGARGGFGERLKVFGREGEVCRRPGCKGTIRRIKVGSRGTRYCPECQK